MKNFRSKFKDWNFQKSEKQKMQNLLIRLMQSSDDYTVVPES